MLSLETAQLNKSQRNCKFKSEVTLPYRETYYNNTCRSQETTSMLLAMSFEIYEEEDDKVFYVGKLLQSFCHQ